MKSYARKRQEDLDARVVADVTRAVTGARQSGNPPLHMQLWMDFMRAELFESDPRFCTELLNCARYFAEREGWLN